MERGAAQRATGATKLNEMSSRSHAVFIIIVEKSTVMAEDSLAAEDEEMEQFRGLAPGQPFSISMLQQSRPCSVPGMQAEICRRHHKCMPYLQRACLRLEISQRSGSGFFCHSMQSIAPTASQLLCCLLSREKMMAFHAQQAVLHPCLMHLYTKKGAILRAVKPNLAAANRLYVPLACPQNSI